MRALAVKPLDQDSPPQPIENDLYHPAYAHANRIASVKELLRSSEVSLTRSAIVIADLQLSISLSLRAIDITRQLIDSSDQEIARMRMLNCK